MNEAPEAKTNKALKILGIIGLTLVIIVVALIVIIRIALNDFIKFNREIEKGNYCLSEQDYDEAERHFNNSIEIFPNRTHGYMGLVEVYAAREDYEKIIDIYYRKATPSYRVEPAGEQLYNEITEALSNLIDLSLDRGDILRAEEIAEELSEINPDAYEKALRKIADLKPDSEMTVIPEGTFYQPTDQEVIDAFYEAREIYGAAMFGGSSSDLLELGDMEYFEDTYFAGYPVLNASSLDEVEDILATVFSRETAERIVKQGGFEVIDGVVYKACLGVGDDISKGNEYIDWIDRESDTKIVLMYHVEQYDWDDSIEDWYYSHNIYVEFYYVYKDGHWYFENMFEPYVDMPAEYK